MYWSEPIDKFYNQNYYNGSEFLNVRNHCLAIEHRHLNHLTTTHSVFYTHTYFDPNDSFNVYITSIILLRIPYIATKLVKSVQECNRKEHGKSVGVFGNKYRGVFVLLSTKCGSRSLLTLQTRFDRELNKLHPPLLK